MNQNSLVTDVFRLLQRRPAGILSDIDGTLSHIADEPGAAVVEQNVKTALSSLIGRLDLVGVVSGRSAQDARRMLELEQLLYLGNHGMERLEGHEFAVAPEALQSTSAVAEVVNLARAKVNDRAVLIENKGVTASIHYRGAANPEQTRAQIIAEVVPVAESAGLRVTYGRMVIEIRPSVMLNKGTALRSIVKERSLRSILFLGDDVTDIDAMDAVAELRMAGIIDGLSIGVIDAESPPAIAKSADQLVDGVDGVREFLEDLVKRFDDIAE